MNTIVTSINYLAVLVSTLVYYVIGFLWFTKLFGEAWRKETGVPADRKPGPVALVGQFISTLLYTIGIAILINLLDTPGIMGGICAAVIATIFFAIPINSGDLFFTGKKRLFLLNVSERAVGSLVVGIILGIWE